MNKSTPNTDISQATDVAIIINGPNATLTHNSISYILESQIHFIKNPKWLINKL